MISSDFSTGKGCAILGAVLIAVPVLILAVVGVQTWVPLQGASTSLVALDRSLGDDAIYVPAPSGAIPAERMEVFLEVRTSLVAASEEYGAVRKGFDSVESLETEDSQDLTEIRGVAVDLGGAALSITPFLARYFELRNDTLLAASMGLQEYSYIYAVAYHDLLLSDRCRNEIFSGGDALSAEAAMILKGCLARQEATMRQAGAENPGLSALEAELEMMESDPVRLIWQDGLPEAINLSITPYRDRLDTVFCSATAGLEMEASASRALRLALE